MSSTDAQLNTARQSLRLFILENYLFTTDQNELSDDTSFLEQGILDSMGILELIDFLNSEFGVAVDDDEMVPEHLDSIDSLIGFLKRKLPAGP